MGWARKYRDILYDHEFLWLEASGAEERVKVCHVVAGKIREFRVEREMEGNEPERLEEVSDSFNANSLFLYLTSFGREFPIGSATMLRLLPSPSRKKPRGRTRMPLAITRSTTNCGMLWVSSLPTGLLKGQRSFRALLPDLGSFWANTRRR